MISGIVITLDHAPARRRKGLAGLGALPHLTLGALDGARLPAVIETTGRSGLRRACERLLLLPGVADVALACVHFEDEDVLEP